MEEGTHSFCYEQLKKFLLDDKTLRKNFIEVENEDARLVVKKINVVIQFETCLEVHIIIRYKPISISILLHFPSLLASGRKYRKYCKGHELSL